MRHVIIAAALALASFASAARDTVIYSGRLANALNAATNRITNLAYPTDASDAVTKSYVDAAGGMTPQNVGTIATNTVTAKVEAWAMKPHAEPATPTVVTNIVDGLFGLPTETSRTPEYTYVALDEGFTITNFSVDETEEDRVRYQFIWSEGEHLGYNTGASTYRMKPVTPFSQDFTVVDEGGQAAPLRVRLTYSMNRYGVARLADAVGIATNAALAVVGPVTSALISVSNAAVSASALASAALPRAEVTNAVDRIVGLEAVHTNGVNRYGLATTNLLTHYLSAHGGTATREAWMTNGVEYVLEGGADRDETEESSAGNGSTLTIKGGGECFNDIGTGGNGSKLNLFGGGYGLSYGGSGAEVTIGEGGYGNSVGGSGGVLKIGQGGDSDGGPAGRGAVLTLGSGGSSYAEEPSEGASLVIGGHGFGYIDGEYVETNGTLTITHTGDLSETLTERISRDAKYAITNDTQLWQDCASPVASNVLANTSTTYAPTNAIVALNQSVQSVNVPSGSSLTIQVPTDEVKDWIVYAHCSDDDTPLVLPSGNYYAADEAYTNALKAGVTAFYFTSCSNGVVIGRQELKPITVE